MAIKAADLIKLIPNKVRISRTVTYEVLWNEDFPKDPNQLGECRSDTKQIVINKNQSNSESFSTYCHEAIHALDFENDIGLTEAQVIKLEQGFVRLCKLNNLLHVPKNS